MTFELTIFATFLTRSGIMPDSAHYFGKSPLGGFFLFFIALSTLIYFLIILFNRKHINHEEDFRLISKEGILFFGILCIIALTLVLIFYTMLPVLSELFYGTKLSVKQHSYNLVSKPFFAKIFMLASIAVLIPYSKIELAKFVKVYILLVLVSAMVTLAAMALGFRNISSVALTFTATTALCAFGYVGLNAVRKSGASIIWRNRRLFGAIFVHIGLALMAYGVVYSSLYSTEADIITSQNSQFSFERYNIITDRVEHDVAGNYHTDFVRLRVFKDGKFVTELTPEIREYNNNRNLFGEVAYYSAPRGDLYFALQGYDIHRNMILLKGSFHPLIMWIWLGAVIMCFGAVYGISQRKLL
jgi:cytochrome c-type biogenesis protein CcmF